MMHLMWFRGARRGMALITALMVSVLFVVLCLSVLTFMQMDMQFTRQQEANVGAFYCARSGLAFFQASRSLFAAGVPVTRNVPDPQATKDFSVVVDSSGTRHVDRHRVRYGRPAGGAAHPAGRGRKLCGYP